MRSSISVLEQDILLCCGCKACGDVCMRNAITFEQNNEGFEYPKVDASHCIGCGRCYDICPVLNTEKIKSIPLDVYACRIKDREVLLSSSSGGMFSALANSVLEEGGVVYGVKYNDAITAVFARIDNKTELPPLRGSKYVQADTNHAYRSVLEDVARGRLVMFIGTPCQTAALRFLSGKYSKHILFVDFICHGVNSPKLFKEYLEYCEKKNSKKIVYYFNRTKLGGWKHVEQACYQDGSIDCSTLLSQAWKNIFYSHCALRPSCSTCSFNHFKKRAADITIADFWGVKENDIGFDSTDGVSLLVAYSTQGRKWFERIKWDIEWRSSTIEKAIERQPHFRGESAQCSNRREFWNYYNDYGISAIIKVYGKCSFTNHFKQLVKKTKIYQWYYEQSNPVSKERNDKIT